MSNSRFRLGQPVTALMWVGLVMGWAGEIRPQEGLPKKESPTPISWRDSALTWEAQGSILVGRFHQAPSKNEASIPRLFNSLGRTVLRQGEKEYGVKVQPELDHWILSWSAEGFDWSKSTIELPLNGPLQREWLPIRASVDGGYALAANQGQTRGSKLRFEPQSYKNTIGYWADAQDVVWWELDLAEAGRFNIELLQGCGTGQGGSQMEIRFLRKDLKEGSEHRATKSSDDDSYHPIASKSFEVIETGHFQNFRSRHLGEIELAAIGAIRVEVSVKSMAKNAAIDIRRIDLVRLP